MVLVLIMCAIVIGALGLLLGGLLARYLPSPALFLVWGALAASAVFLFFRARATDEFQSIGDNVLLYSVLLPFLIGGLLAACIVRRRQRRKPD